MMILTVMILLMIAHPLTRKAMMLAAPFFNVTINKAEPPAGPTSGLLGLFGVVIATKLLASVVIIYAVLTLNGRA